MKFKQEYTLILEDITRFPEIMAERKADFIAVISELLTVLDNRDRKYGLTNFHDLRKKYPNAAIFEMEKKISRIRTGLNNGIHHVDSYIDIAGYAILELIELMKEREEDEMKDNKNLKETNDMRAKMYEQIINEYHQKTNDGSEVMLNEVACGKTPLIKTNTDK